MKRATIAKRNFKSKSPTKVKTFLNRPELSSTTALTPSRERAIVNRPSSSGSAQPQKRLLTPSSASLLKNQRKSDPPVGQTSPQKNVPPQESPRVVLHDFLKFDEEVKQGNQEMSEVTEEELIAVDFDINGVTITAKMSSTMVQLMNENEILREQIIEKLLAENTENPGEHIIITTDEPAPSEHLPNQSIGVSDVPSPVKERINGNGSTKFKTVTQTGTPAGNKPVRTNPSFKRRIDPVEGIPSMWGDGTVATFLEVYEILKEKLHLQDPPAEFFWKAVCKHMMNKGYVRVTDKECQKKFESMETTYKELVKQGITSQTSTWRFFDKMKQLLAGNFKPKPLLPVAKPSTSIVDPHQSPMYQSGGSSSEDNEQPSDEEVSKAMNLDDLMTNPPKKQKLSSPDEPSEVELLRRTYLKVETKKLEEMKAMRKLQRQQSRLQAERNILLSSIVDLLRKNSVQVKKR